MDWQGVDESQLSQIAQAIVAELASKPRYVVWLDGEMGAGKTTLVTQILYALGLESSAPVQSPTFTYMSDYHIAEDWYGHLDLYRADDRFRIEELGVFDAHNYRGLFIEWPEQGGCGGYLDPDWTLRISIRDAQRRDISLKPV